MAGDRPAGAAGAGARGFSGGGAGPRPRAPRAEGRALVPPRARGAAPGAVRADGRRAARRLRALRESARSLPPPRGGGAPLHRGAVRGAGRDRRQPAHRVRRAGGHGQDVARHRDGAARRLGRAAGAPTVLQPSARPLAAGGDGVAAPGRGRTTGRHGAHAARAHAPPRRGAADAGAGLQPGLLAGGAAGTCAARPAGARRKGGVGRRQVTLPVRRGRARRSSGRAAPQLPRLPRPQRRRWPRGWRLAVLRGLRAPAYLRRRGARRG